MTGSLYNLLITEDTVQGWYSRLTYVSWFYNVACAPTDHDYDQTCNNKIHYSSTNTMLYLWFHSTFSDVFCQIFLLCFPQVFRNPHFQGKQKRRKYISRTSKSWMYFYKDRNVFYKICDCNCVLIVASWWLWLECQQRATNATSDENNTCWWPPETFSSTLEWSHHDHDFSPLKPINYPSHYNVWNSI